MTERVSSTLRNVCYHQFRKRAVLTASYISMAQFMKVIQAMSNSPSLCPSTQMYKMVKLLKLQFLRVLFSSGSQLSQTVLSFCCVFSFGIYAVLSMFAMQTCGTSTTENVKFHKELHCEVSVCVPVGLLVLLVSLEGLCTPHLGGLQSHFFPHDLVRWVMVSYQLSCNVRVFNILILAIYCYWP